MVRSARSNRAEWYRVWVAVAALASLLGPVMATEHWRPREPPHVVTAEVALYVVCLGMVRVMNFDRALPMVVRGHKLKSGFHEPG